MTEIVYGCCVGSWDKFQRYVLPYAHERGRHVIATGGHTDIVTAYNWILDAMNDPDQQTPDALVLQHDDLEITDPDAEDKFVRALGEPDVALVGVAGGGGDSLYWWNHAPVGHQLTDVLNIEFGARAGDVTLVEGSLMVLSPWAITHLRFDPRFPDFHGYDEIGMQVRARGMRSVVVDVDTHHHNKMGYRSPESAAICARANELYREKWFR